jgi:hypothetical protein
MLPNEHLDDGAMTALPTRNPPSPKKPVSIAPQAAPFREGHFKHLDNKHLDLLLRAFGATALHYITFLSRATNEVNYGRLGQ